MCSSDLIKELVESFFTMVFVSMNQAAQIIKKINEIEKLELDPHELEEGCPHWDDFTEGQHHKFGKTKNFQKYSHMVPKRPGEYYEKGNSDYEKQQEVQNKITKKVGFDFDDCLSSSLKLTENQMSEIVKESDVSLQYVQDIIQLKKIGEDWLAEHT